MSVSASGLPKVTGGVGGALSVAQVASGLNTFTPENPDVLSGVNSYLLLHCVEAKLFIDLLRVTSAICC